MKLSVGLSLTALLLSLTVCQAADDVVLMSFFRGNGQAGVYLCVSADGLKFRPLNNDKPVMAPAKWPKQGLTRDPSILYRDGKFRLVWTSNWTGQMFGYAESTDLVNWTAPVQVAPFPDSADPADTPNNVWAPEIHWDQVQQNYLILWSTSTKRSRGHHIYACRTTDGKTFTPAQRFFDPGFTVIDAQMLLDNPQPANASGARWVMVVKDERGIKEGGKNLHLTTAPLDFSRPWAPLSSSVFGPGSNVRPEEQVEGGCLVKIGGEYRLYGDAFSSHHYSVATSSNLVTWTDLTPQLELPKGVRHGTIFVAPRAAVGWLQTEAKP